MPMYDYQCKDCGERFSVIVSWWKRDQVKCPKCGGNVNRLLSSFAVNSPKSNCGGNSKRPFG